MAKIILPPAAAAWREKHKNLKGNLIAGTSGGRSSALTAYMVPDSTILCFQNTGKEHEKTLEFLCRIEDSIGRPIRRIEFRAPPRGNEPKYATFEEVTHQTMSRKGEPFKDFMLCLASYRAKHKGKGPVGPWARSRICTSYMKIKTKIRFCASLGWAPQDYTDFVGLRADEEDRISKMHERNDVLDTDERAPLAEAGIKKADVLSFFQTMPFDLEIPEYLGNCDACFLKDEGDLALALTDPSVDHEWWFWLDETFVPLRRKASTYRQIYEEAPHRRRIRTALECGVEYPENTGLPQRRHHLIVLQERRRMKEGATSFSCSCDQAPNIRDEDLLKE